MTFRHLSPLRWSDLDAQGHVNNAIYVDFLQEARVGFLRSGPVGALLDSGVVVVSHALEYQAPIEYAEGPVQTELGISKLGAARFEVSYELTQQGVLKARARTVLCPFDFETQLPRRLSPEERAYLAAHQVDVPAFASLPQVELAGQGYPTPITVRWSDLDSYRHVNNVKFYDFVMQARIDMTTAIDPTMARTGAGTEAEHTWLVVRQDMTYLKQLDHKLTPYTVRTAPVKLGNSSITLTAEICDEDSIYARSTTVLVCGDLSGRPIPLPDATRARVAEHLVN